ncbi:MAG TPA: peptidylprolyl isomerase [Bacteroidales bacterium]|nr:peptidylprolyl isomerase [Bacteroidales bacterium]HOU82176.1 peptidylprolyl isomerase [Bacteroidales bacterium]HPL02700.1 peptidylprolyl isomerase [Bacteroidales bacterium]HQE77763.1 peptidylprolyl isomerase [Bacteroidales bacterium]HQH59310.1 peptidylprolyl isomerase [Bacteroidales bacterium]
MKKYLSIAILSIFLSLTLIGQNDKTLLVIENQKVPVSEFLDIYTKNNKNVDYSKASIDEYLDLFINYKLKLMEIQRLRLDTQKNFINEFQKYRDQLAQSYLIDKNTVDKLLNEAYNRMQNDVRVSHILVKLSPYANPKDTLKAYNKALEIRKKLLNGADFAKLAIEMSDDNSARDQNTADGRLIPGNGGDLGYFNVFNMLYDFETAAYNLNVGDISLPVRTPVGYHIIKLTEKHPAIYRFKIAHILLMYPPNATTQDKESIKAKADSIYKEILSGADFAELANLHSEDKGSANKGGELPWLTPFRLVPSFVQPIYNHKPGDYIPPVETFYGWHIIKLIDKQSPPDFASVKQELLTKLYKDSRYLLAQKKIADSLKQIYKIQYDKKLLVNIAKSINKDSLVKRSFKESQIPNLDNILVKIDDHSIYIKDFATYIKKNQSLFTNTDDIQIFVNKMFDNFLNDKILEIEKENLEKKNPKFAAQINDYKEGILIFNLMDQNVWSKAMQDTAGLKAYYETIKNKYLTDEKAKIGIFKTNDAKIAQKVQKTLQKNIQKSQLNPNLILSKINKKNNVVSYDSMVIETKKLADIGLEKTVNAILSKENNNSYEIYWLQSIIAPQPKSLDEVRGLVISEYQTYLEKQWINELRSRYHWQVNDEVLKSLYKN